MADDPAPSAPLLGPPAPDPRPVPTVDLDWRSVAWALAAFVALVALTGLVRSAPRTITFSLVGGLLALALNPIVVAAQRRMGGRRGAAVAAVLVGFTATVVGLVALVTPPAIREARQLQDQLPEVIRDLDNMPVLGRYIRDSNASESVQRWIEELPRRLEGNTAPIERAGRAVADGVLAAFLTLLISVSLLIDGERLVARARRLVPPRRRAQAERVAGLAYDVVGRYVAGSVFVAVIAGVAVLVAGLVLRVPLTPLVAAWVMVFDLVPQIGGAVGGIPFVLLGLTRSATTGLACAVFFILYLQLENHVISPLVVGKTVKLSPPATMTAALVGVSAAGVVGALIAVPLVGAVKVAYTEVTRTRAA